MAKLAEEAERYEDMQRNVKELAELDSQLSVEERNLLSVAYKNVVGARRASWRVLSSIETKEKERGNDERAAMIEKYRKSVEDELNDICSELLDLLDKHLLPSDSTPEGTVFYHKMRGDYYRYKAEFATGQEREDASKAAFDAYTQANETAIKDLPSTNPIRLGLALNFSVYQYEIRGQPTEACALAKGAFDAAIQDLDKLPEAEYRDSTLIMQLIRDNLTLWTSDDANEGAEGVDGDNAE